MSHIPVMINEVIKTLNPKDNETILDGTFGAGGYTKCILNSCNCNVIGTDRDITVLKFAEDVKKEYGNRFNFINAKFSEISQNIDNNSLDGLVLDLGVSSMQLDNADRGFSFNKDAKLSMAMGRNNITAYDIVNNFSEIDLANIIYEYGEEVKSRIISKAIINYRKTKLIETTLELAEIVKNCFPRKYYKINPATKTFQAIRIYVNDELNELKKILEDSKRLLKQDGRLVIVTFHSLEDRIVKNFFKENSNLEKINKYRQKCDNTIEEKSFAFNLPSKGALIVSEKEAISNPRSRSAKLRWGIKC